MVEALAFGLSMLVTWILWGSAGVVAGVVDRLVFAGTAIVAVATFAGIVLILSIWISRPREVLW